MKNIVYLTIAVLLSGLLFFNSCKKDETGDGIPPVIEIQGANPMYWALDIEYIDPGAISYDVTQEGDTLDITGSITTQNTVDVSTEGEYTVSYNVKDDSGLSAEEKIRIVKIVPGKK